jgi:hypothetical protein
MRRRKSVGQNCLIVATQRRHYDFSLNPIWSGGSAGRLSAGNPERVAIFAIQGRPGIAVATLVILILKMKVLQSLRRK